MINSVLAGRIDKTIFGELLEYHFGFTRYTKPIIATLWNISEEKIVQTISKHTDDFGLGMDMSSNYKLLATASKDRTIKIWGLK